MDGLCLSDRVRTSVSQEVFRAVLLLHIERRQLRLSPPGLGVLAGHVFPGAGPGYTWRHQIETLIKVQEDDKYQQIQLKHFLGLWLIDNLEWKIVATHPPQLELQGF